jgi:hypothetical protein
MSSATLDARRTYTCPHCQHVLRVAGLGRHAVYFELTDERLDDPIMDRVCSQCRTPLPGKKAG